MISRRRSLKWFALGSVLAVAVIVAVVNLLGASNSRRVDLTRDRIYSISPELRKIIDGLSDKVTITLYASDRLPPQFLSAERFMEDNLQELVVKSNGRIIARVEKVGQEPERESELARLGIHRIPVGIIERDQHSIANIYFQLLVQYGPRHHVVNMPDESGFEYQLAHALTKVSINERPRIVFVENDPQFDFIAAVEQIGKQLGLNDIYEFRGLKVEQDYPLVIPANTKLLVLCKPVDFREQELFEIDQYLMAGGHVLVFAEPTDFANPFLMFERNPRDPRYNIYPLLAQYGIDVRASLVEDFGSALQIPVSGSSEGGLMARVPATTMTIATADNFTTSTQILAATQRLLFPLPAPLELRTAPAVDAEPLVWSSPLSKLQPGPDFDLRTLAKPVMPEAGSTESFLLAASIAGAMPSFYAGKPMPEPLKVTSTRSQYEVQARNMEGFTFVRRDVAEPTARLTVFSSGRMLSQRMLGNLQQLDPALYNEQLNFLAGMLESTALGTDLMSIRRKRITIPVFREDLTERERQVARVASTFGVPALLCLLGLVNFLRRRARLAALRKSYAR